MNILIQFTDTAKEDLGNIVLYISDRSGDKSTAVRFVTELREKCKILESFPEIGSVPKDRILASGGYRFLVHKEYLIFYRYRKQENKVYIMAIFNSKRDYTKALKKIL